MQQRNVAREAGLVVASLAVLVHWLEPGPALLVAVLIVAAAASGTGPLVGEWRPWHMPVVPMVLPGLAAFSIAGIAHIVSPVPWLGVVFVAGWVGVAWVFNLETAPDVLTADETVAPVVATTPPKVKVRPRRRSEYDLAEIVAEPVIVTTPELPPHPHPLAVRFASVSLAFFGFVAAGALVPDGLALDRHALSTTQMLEFVALNAVIAGAVGYRLASLTSPHRFDRIVRVVAFGIYAVPIAVVAAALRSLDLPRLLIPALLTLSVYMITDLRESTVPIREDLGLLQRLVWMGVAGLAVLVWGLVQ
jgi:hypothetical protein